MMTTSLYCKKWTLIPLGEVCSLIRNGLSIKQADDAGGLPISRIETIASSEIDRSRVGYAGIVENQNQEWLLQSGDILFSHINSLSHLGKCAIYRGEPLKLIHGMNLLVLRSDRKRISPDFLLRLLRTPQFRTQLLRFVNQSVNQVSVSTTNLRLIEIPLPHLEEQRRIAAILDKADAVRRKRQQAIALTEELLRSAFLEMFGDPVTNPKGWDIVNLKSQIAELRYGTSVKCNNVKENDNLPVLRIPNIIGEQISWNDMKYAELETKEVTKLLLKPGDILFVRTNGNPEYIGRCALFEKGYGDTLYASYLIRARLKPNARLHPAFVRDIISFPTYRSHLVREARTTAGNYNINTEGLGRLRLIEPPWKEQEIYLQFAEKLKAHVKKQKSQLEETDRIFNSLLQKAFWGEL